MFEKEIKFIGDFCLNQVRSLGNSLTFEKIQESNLHPAVVRYVSAELDYMIYADRRKLLQQSFFDYSGKEIAEHFYRISNEIKRNKKISTDDLQKLILQAVSFNVNYLVRPRWSLTKLIFNEQPIISVNDLQMILNYLYYYEYFKKVLSAYLDKRNLTQITLTEFDLILNKIDREIFNSNPELLLENALSSMGDFFNIGGVDKNIVSSSAIEIFLKEKNMLDMVFKLRKGLPEGVKKQFDKNDVIRILFAGKPEESIDEEEQEEGKEVDLETELENELQKDLKKETELIEENEKKVELTEEQLEEETDEQIPDSFLSPEEEKTLLSLYNREITDEQEAFNKMEANVEDEIKEDLDQQADEKLNKEIEEIRNSIDDYFPEFKSEFTSELDKIIFEEETQEEIDDKIKNEITDNESSVEIEEEMIQEADIPESIKSNSGVEKEIVQEMLKDFIGNEVSESKSEIEGKEIINEKNKNLEPVEKKVTSDSLEDELLHIFEDLDTIDASNFRRTKLTEEDADEQKPDEKIEEVAEQASEPEELDPLDEYLKSVDEIIFSDKKDSLKEESVAENETGNEKDSVADTDETTAEPVEEIASSDFEKNKEPVKQVDKSEKPIHPPRTKDLFSYLRKKEIKKIVSYIFINDEEDFINTAERIMDCHSYKEASEILKAVFTSYKISPYSKEAITFTNAVSNYFRQA